MKNVKNFQIAKVQSHVAAQHLLIFFTSFTLKLLIKVLLLKQIMYYKKISQSANIRNECVIRKEFFVIKNDQILSSKVCYFQYYQGFLFSREMGNIGSCKEVRLQKAINFKLSGQYSFQHCSKFLKMKNYLGRVSLSHFFAKCFDRNFKYLF